MKFTKTQIIAEKDAQIDALKKKNKLYFDALSELKTGSGETIAKGNSTNPLWVYEKTTKALAKAEMV